MARARMSEVPPAANGTTMRIGLFGYCWPRAGRAASRLAAKTVAKAAAMRFMGVLRVRYRASVDCRPRLLRQPRRPLQQIREVLFPQRGIAGGRMAARLLAQGNQH